MDSLRCLFGQGRELTHGQPEVLVWSREDVEEENHCYTTRALMVL